MRASNLVKSALQAVVPIVSLGFVSACNGVTAPEIKNASEIVGGKTLPQNAATRANVVALVSKDGALCSGTLVTQDVVATAGHCMLEGGMDYVVFGDNINSPSAVTRKIVDSDTLLKDQNTFPNYDVAWVKFEGSLPSGYKPAKILSDVTKLTKGQTLTLVGYGKTGDSEAASVGKRLTVDSVYSDFVNNDKYKNIIVVGPNLGKGDCHGDSGGPTFARVGGELLLVSTLSGLDDTLTPELTCKSGHTVHNFLGAYKGWIEKSTGEKLL